MPCSCSRNRQDLHIPYNTHIQIPNNPLGENLDLDLKCLTLKLTKRFTFLSLIFKFFVFLYVEIKNYLCYEEQKNWHNHEYIHKNIPPKSIEYINKYVYCIYIKYYKYIINIKYICL